LVSQRLAADAPLERLDDLGRKSVGIGGERRFKPDPCNLPVARRGVLARGALLHAAVRPRRARLLGNAHDLGEPSKAERAQVWQGEAADARSHVAQGVAPLVAVFGRVRRFADAYA